jgi:hypothetical protein
MLTAGGFMAIAHVSWTSEVVQEPAGSMEAVAWQVKLYMEVDGSVVTTVSEPLATMSHDFLVGEGDYHVGVQALDVNGQVAGEEVMSAMFTVAAGMVSVTRPGIVTVEVLP